MLSSGRTSEHYINCKPVTLSGKGLVLVSDMILDKLEPDTAAVGGLTLGADPVVSGVKIAKHGNKSASGKVGSADVLLNLGINLNSSLEKVISAIDKVGITFLFAPAWHKSLIKLAPLRKAHPRRRLGAKNTM